MTDLVADCPVHGYHDGQTCSHCGTRSSPVLDGASRKRLSKFCSGALRHFPSDAGLTLDDAGWAAWDSLVESVVRRYDWASEEAVSAVVTTDPKGRFETRRTEGEKAIRAAYGHSVAVDIDSGAGPDHPGDLPERLYHGTVPRVLDTIRTEGLRPMGRQCVHLSGSRETARAVGQRHTAGDPVVLSVDVRALVDAGFDVRKRGSDTYTVARVPPEYLSADK